MGSGPHWPAGKRTCPCHCPRSHIPGWCEHRPPTWRPLLQRSASNLQRHRGALPTLSSYFPPLPIPLLLLIKPVAGDSCKLTHSHVELAYTTSTPPLSLLPTAPFAANEPLWSIPCGLALMTPSLKSPAASYGERRWVALARRFRRPWYAELPKSRPAFAQLPPTLTNRDSNKSFRSLSLSLSPAKNVRLYTATL